MSWRKTVVYLIILCALGSWLYFYEIKHKGQKKAEEEKASRLICIDNDSVDEVKIKKDDGTVIQLKKIEGKWMLVEPVKTAADQSAVQGVVATLTSLKPERILKEKEVNWEEYGLQKPSFEATVAAKDVRNHIFFGDQNPSKSSYYMKKDDDPRLFLVADTVKNALNKSVFDLRDKDVLAIAPADVDRVAIRNNDKEIEIKREGPEKWVLTKPESMKLKANLMNRDLNTLANLKAKDIIDNPNLSDEKFGLTAPKIAITLAGPKLEQVLSVGAPVKSDAAHPLDSEVYASVKGKDAVYVVDLKNLKTLIQSDLNVLRDKSLMTFAPNDVEKFEMELDGKKWVAVRKDNSQWSLEEPKGITSLDSWNITSILWELRDLEWKSMSKAQTVPAELAQPKLVASLSIKGQKEPVVLKAGWASQPSPSEAHSEPQTAESAKKQEHQGGEEAEPKTAPSPGSGSEGSKQAGEQKAPEVVTAVVTPSDEKDMVYQVSGTFVTRVRKDLEKILEKK
ncbi:MAG: DUF4340 domain-containing protein [Desulfomonilaceae bacterium]